MEVKPGKIIRRYSSLRCSMNERIRVGRMLEGQLAGEQ